MRTAWLFYIMQGDYREIRKRAKRQTALPFCKPTPNECFQSERSEAENTIEEESHPSPLMAFIFMKKGYHKGMKSNILTILSSIAIGLSILCLSLHAYTTPLFYVKYVENLLSQYSMAYITGVFPLITLVLSSLALKRGANKTYHAVLIIIALFFLYIFYLGASNYCGLSSQSCD